MTDDENDATRLAPKPPSSGSARTSGGWLSSSGSIDHGRFNPGTVLDGRYRIIGLLGRGGMGEVYRADDLRLGQQVALKFLPETLAGDPIRLAQFHNEVRTARQVSHPNVCRMYDIGEVDEQLFLTMEYVDGEDLSSLLRRIGRLPEDKALEIARQLCAGLAAAHERGVLHRDLKPANIMLDSAGRVRVMDFSLAAVGEVTDIRAGTPAYMAPEQLQGREVTVRSDIYALGLVLYELFTGRRAYDAKTLHELLEQHASGTVTAPTELVKGFDPVIERAILRCLDPSPAQRPASALAVSASLPGGDPLAAALAAGETPSPEMVAAAGGENAAVSAGVGMTLFAGVCVALVALAMIHDRTDLLARVPLAKPQVVLADRAGEIRKSLGYTATGGDIVWGYYADAALLDWATRAGWGKDNWARLATGRPAAVGFWYRRSPNVMVPYDRDRAVSFFDPPAIAAGMIRMQLDPDGRLLSFEAIPPRGEDAAVAATPVNWDPLFAAAGIERSSFVEVAPKLNPRTFADERKAWKETGGELLIEGAGYRGRAVSFVLLGPWEQVSGQSSASASQPPAVLRVIGLLIVAAVPFGAALLARRNIRLGRSDRRGAFRAWAVVAGAGFFAWVISPNHVHGLEEVDRLFASTGSLLFWSGVVYVVYLALEPGVRRSWPTVLITWSRLLGGRIRDPLVGRDLLIGTLVGVGLSILAPMLVLIPSLTGQPSPAPVSTSLTPLYGFHHVFAKIAGSPSEAMLNGVIVVLILSLIRQGLKSLAQKIGANAAGRIVGSTASTVIAGVIIFIIVTKRSSIDPTYPALDLAFSMLLLTVLVLVVLRFGLFATCVAFWVLNLAGDFPLTLDSSKIYAGPVFFVMALTVAFAGLGLWMARGRASATS